MRRRHAAVAFTLENRLKMSPPKELSSTPGAGVNPERRRQAASVAKFKGSVTSVTQITDDGQC